MLLFYSYWSGVDDILRKLIYEKEIKLKIISSDNSSDVYITALSALNDEVCNIMLLLCISLPHILYEIKIFMPLV